MVWPGHDRPHRRHHRASASAAARRTSSSSRPGPLRLPSELACTGCGAMTTLPRAPRSDRRGGDAARQRGDRKPEEAPQPSAPPKASTRFPFKLLKFSRQRADGSACLSLSSVKALVIDAGAESTALVCDGCSRAGPMRGCSNPPTCRGVAPRARERPVLAIAGRRALAQFRGRSGEASRGSRGVPVRRRGGGAAARRPAARAGRAACVRSTNGLAGWPASTRS